MSRRDPLNSMNGKQMIARGLMRLGTLAAFHRLSSERPNWALERDRLVRQSLVHATPASHGT
jgi:hypothetical protein